MGYQPYVLQDFGAGLNLSAKADAVGPGEAIDALNVVFTDRGAVRQRDGYSALTSSALTNAVGSLEPYYTTAGTKQLLAGCGTRLEALDTSGAVVASATGLTSGTWDFARFGAPNAEVAYAGNGQNLLRKWDGSAWSSIANSPKAGSLCVSTPSNRLVCSRFLTTTGGPAAGVSSPSHVYFSDAGLPETYTANNYVQLTPGDGEQLQAVIAWREYVFAFKQTKFFVFNSEGLDASGNPIFNYRIVNTGVGLVAPQAVVATEAGIFFCDRRGVFLTTGDTPTKVSGPIDPIFLGNSEGYYAGGELDHSLIGSLAMGVHRDQVYVAYSTNGTYNDRVLVYDYPNGWWSLWDIPVNGFAEFRPSNVDELVFGYATGSNRVGRHYEGLTNDAGVAITSRWRSGFQDFEIPDNKKIRQSKAWGAGLVQFSVSPDYQTSAGAITMADFTTPSSTTWGGSTWGGGTWVQPQTLVPELIRRAIRGTTFSTTLANNILDNAWQVHRIEHHLVGMRQPSIEMTDA